MQTDMVLRVVGEEFADMALMWRRGKGLLLVI